MNRGSFFTRPGWLVGLSGLILLLGSAPRLAAWDFRSITVATLDLYLPQAQDTTQDWGLMTEEVLLIRLIKDAGWFLKTTAGLASRGSDLISGTAGMGFSLPLSANLYLNAACAGKWRAPDSGFAGNLSGDLNYEDATLWAAISGYLGFGQNVLTSLWGLSGKYQCFSWLALMASAQAGWDQSTGWDGGGWGYAEFLPAPLKIRLGGSVGSFHDQSAWVKAGMEYSVLAQFVWQVIDGLELNLNGQWWFGDRNSNKRSLGLSASILW